MTDCTAVRHGALAAYMTSSCRCPAAREEYRLYRKRIRHGRHQPRILDGTGSARRLQSLARNGYCIADLADRLGYTRKTLREIRNGRQKAVTRATADAIATLFRRLDGTDGGSLYAKTCARRSGWVDAAAWDNINDPAEEPKLGDPDADLVDEVLVERVLEGQRAPLSPANQLLAVQVGSRRGLALNVIGARLHVSYTTAQALRDQLREQQAA